MTATSPLRPKILKGAIASYSLLDLVPTIVVFQYNPEEMSRDVVARGADGGGRGDSHRVSGPPGESIAMTVHLDAADQLEFPADNPITAKQGLHPAIAALEGLMHPAYPLVVANEVVSLRGTAFIANEEAPYAFLVWGVRRVLPVRVSGVRIRETAFDTRLNPIRATAELSMTVPTYREMAITNPGYWVYMAAFAQKEVMAELNIVNLGSGGPPPEPPV